MKPRSVNFTDDVKNFNKLDLNIPILPTSLELTTYMLQTVASVGYANVEVRATGCHDTKKLKLYVVENNYENLLGMEWVNNLKINWTQIIEQEKEIGAKVFKHLAEYNIRLNEGKRMFLQNSIIYWGFKLSENVISKCGSHVKAILSIREPKNITEVRASLVIVNFYGIFLKELSSVAYILNKLLYKSVPFKFDIECKQAFQQIKEFIASDLLLVFYDIKKKITRATIGLRVILSHVMEDQCHLRVQL